MYFVNVLRSIFCHDCVDSYQAISSENVPSRSNCMNNSPPERYSKIKYNFPPCLKCIDKIDNE